MVLGTGRMERCNTHKPPVHNAINPELVSNVVELFFDFETPVEFRGWNRHINCFLGIKVLQCFVNGIRTANPIWCITKIAFAHVVPKWMLDKNGSFLT